MFTLEALTSLFQQALLSAHSVVPNWPAAIACLAIVLKLLLAPLQLFTFKQQKLMQATKERFDELREKYGKDPARYLSETRALKARVGIKSGRTVVATLLQGVIFLGMYKAITTGSLLSGVSFMWLTSLAVPDPLYLLPLLLAAVSYLQVRQTPQPVPVPRWTFPALAAVFGVALPAASILFSVSSSLTQFAIQRGIERWF